MSPTERKPKKRPQKGRSQRDEAPPPERRERRSLSHVGGPVEKLGDDESLLEALERALTVRSDERFTLTHVHGFHSYPARLHPETAARLVAGLTRSGATVLDPFCGSGTVLVEAHRLGRRALGVDANPLAIELSWLKTRGFDAKERAALLETARQVVEHADERRRAKAGPSRSYAAADRELFDPHVLLELDGLRDGIAKLARGDQQRALALVLSAILTKASRRPGDTAERTSPRRLPGGFAIRFFERKTEDLVRRLLEYSAGIPPGTPRVKLAVGDARDLERVRDRSVDLVLTSPPYPGVYDYHSHHAARLRWLGLEDKKFEKREIGARRRAREQEPAAAVDDWRRDFGACLAEMRRVLAPTGRAAIVIADSAIAGRALRADITVGELASRAGLTLAARASQARPNFHAPSQRAFRSGPRREHVLVFGHR
jgi:DNA modification methylase